jgi:hypothetical protein
VVFAEGEPVTLLLVPAAGGLMLELDGREITLLTPASALYQKLLGMRVGDYREDGELLVLEVI